MYQWKPLRQLLGNGRRDTVTCHQSQFYPWHLLLGPNDCRWFSEDEMVHDSTTVERVQHWVLFRRSLRNFVSCNLFWDFFKAAASPAAKELVCQCEAVVSVLTNTVVWCWKQKLRAIDMCAYPQPGCTLIPWGWYQIIRMSRVEITSSVICSYFLHLFLQVTVTVINQLLEKIRQDLPGLEETDETELIRRQFESTISHVQLKKESPEEGSPSYEEIRI